MIVGVLVIIAEKKDNSWVIDQSHFVETRLDDDDLDSNSKALNFVVPGAHLCDIANTNDLWIAQGNAEWIVLDRDSDILVSDSPVVFLSGK